MALSPVGKIAPKRHNVPAIKAAEETMAVLIVEDDPVQRRLLEGMVQKFGYEVVTAERGDPAAALLTGPDGAAIDCVILDLVMPDLDGLGVLARLRRNAIAAPVIVQTAHGGIDRA
jgi:CheY-like chemotaxis protein